MAEIEILSPGPDDRTASGPSLAARTGRLRGQVVGVVNNSWRCMDIVTSEIVQLLKEECGVAEIVEERISAAQTLPDERLEALASRCSVAIVGMGN